MDKRIGEAGNAQSQGDAGVIRNVAAMEQVEAHGTYRAVCMGPVEAHRAEYIRLRDFIEKIKRRLPIVWRVAAHTAIKRMNAIPMEQKWADEFANVVTTEGKNAHTTRRVSVRMVDSSFLGAIYPTGLPA